MTPATRRIPVRKTPLTLLNPNPTEKVDRRGKVKDSRLPPQKLSIGRNALILLYPDPG